MANKIRYGIKNVHTSKITTTGSAITFGVPEKLLGAKSISLDPQGESSPNYFDDMVYFVTSANNGYKIDLELALIPDKFKVDYLGFVKSDDNLLIEDASAQPKPFSLLFEFDGDSKATRHILYNCVATRSKLDGKSKEDKIDPATETIQIVAMPIEASGKMIVKGNTTDETTAVNYDAFFTKAPALPEFTPVP